jgi:RimJ/RimL family protein N-acetyltransferase
MDDKRTANKYGLIETERLILREWTADDYKAIVDGLNNINVVKYLTTPPYPYTIKDAEEFVNSAGGNTKDKVNFAITLKETGEVIGGCGGKSENGIWGGGIWLREKFHGKGYGTEAYKARTKFILEVCEAEEIKSGYFFDNKGSKNMHEKIGFRLNGDIREDFCKSRNCMVLCYMNSIRKEWLK